MQWPKMSPETLLPSSAGGRSHEQAWTQMTQIDPLLKFLIKDRVRGLSILLSDFWGNPYINLFLSYICS